MYFLEYVENVIQISKIGQKHCLGVSKPAKQLAAQGTAYALPKRQSKQAFVKESEKKYLCNRNVNL